MCYIREIGAFSFLSLCVLLWAPGWLYAQFPQLVLPTDNDALLEGEGPDFYQYTDRRIRAGYALPWEGGTYGFVRNVRNTNHGLIYTRFHEGVDIKPVRRDRRGEPLDEVRSIDEGVVVHVSVEEKKSSYGKYVVVEHWWNGAAYYSLYAHLGDINVQWNQKVGRGERLGRVGYTGRGINRRRAHLHLEINMMLNAGCFRDWHSDHFSDENHHNVYNGLNLAGIDVARFYLTLDKFGMIGQDLPQREVTTAGLEMVSDSMLTVQKFIQQEVPFFKVTVPNKGAPELMWRYAWLLPGKADPWMTLVDPSDMLNDSWDFYFNQSGVPIKIEPVDRVVYEAELEVLQHSPISYKYLTKGFIDGSSASYQLTDSGMRYIDLLTRVSPGHSQILDDGPASCELSLRLDPPSEQ